MRHATHAQRALWLAVLLGIVVANYLAQIVYYLHLYYFPHHAPPSLFGSIALMLTLVWFLAGYVGTRRGNAGGYWLLVSYLLAMVLFYALNMVNQVGHGFSPFFHLHARDPILFVVFAIGYLNLLAGVGYLVWLVSQWDVGGLRVSRGKRQA